MIPPTDALRLAERMRPDGAPWMQQRWSHLLFLHWSWDPAAIQRTLPAELTVDVFGGRAWVGLVPFFMERVRPRGFPALAGFSDFLELNVRTYVHDSQGRPGVWFYSLDCNQWLAVKGARTFFHLPYQHATMSALVDEENGEVEYGAKRRGTSMESRFRWAPSRRAAVAAAPGSREFFLIERYRLFTRDRENRLLSGRVHHVPYRVKPTAAVPMWDDTMLRLAGLEVGTRPPDHCCVAETVDVEVWPLRPVAEGARVDDIAGEALGPVGVPA